MTNNRKCCITIMNNICLRMSGGLSLADLPDLPYVMNALDEMEELIERWGDGLHLSELQNIAQDAVVELLEEEGFEV